MNRRKRKTVQITDLDLHKSIKVLAAEKGVTIEEIIRIGVEMIKQRSFAKKDELI